MLIVCPTCESRYDIAADAIGKSGRSVRCSRCRTEWRVMPEGSEILPFDDEMASDTDDDDGTGLRAEGQSDEVVDAAALEEGAIEPVSSPQPLPAARPRKPIRARGRPRSGKGLPWAKLGLAAGLAAVVFLFAASSTVVRVFPQTASLYAHLGMAVNVRGFAFEGVRTTLVIEEGNPVLVVEGTIRSISPTPMPVPRLRLSVQDEKGTEIYNWTAVVSREALPPGAALPFKTRVATPPPEAKTVAVRFLLRRDMVVASR